MITVKQVRLLPAPLRAMRGGWKKLNFAKLGARALAALTAGTIMMTPILAEADNISNKPVGDQENILSEPEATPTEEPEATPTEEPEATPTEEPEVTPTEEPEVTPTEEPEVTPTATGIPTEIPTETGKPEESQENEETTRTTVPVPAENPSYGNYSYSTGYGLTNKSGTFSRKNISLFTLTDSKPMTLKDVPDYLNVREGRSISSRAVGALYPGSICNDIDTLGDPNWTYIEAVDQYGNVIRGYVFSSYVEPAGEEEKGDPNRVIRYISESYNKAFRDNNQTTQPKLLSLKPDVSAERQEIIKFGKQFIGNPYVWGGESLTEGTDCSGFTQQVFGHFGISLPRCSYEQAETGEHIPLDEAEPGDLVFYARDGVVYHVMIWLGNGQILHASSSTTGIIISNVNPERVCWCVNVLDPAGQNNLNGSTLLQTVNNNLPAGENASQIIADIKATAETQEDTSEERAALQEKLEKAADGDCKAQEEVLTDVVEALQDEWKDYGIAPSVIAATLIENGWSFDFSEDLSDDELRSAVMDGLPMTAASKLIGMLDIETGELNEPDQDPYESCIDFAIKLSEEHPDAVGLVWGPGIAEELTETEAEAGRLVSIYEEYGLGEYDTDPLFVSTGTFTAATDGAVYTEEDMELIWAIVAQEDDTSYEGALAVISSAMNRADINYGGYGNTALAQLTADGQYCYSPKVSDPSFWQRRLEGNVPDEVKEAVEDCLTRGIRNNTYLNFRSSNRTGNYVQIGSNWYF